MIDSILALVSTTLISYIITSYTIPWAIKNGFVTDKKKRHHPAHTHNGVIPRGGGIPIFLSLFIASIIFIGLNKIMVGILIASFLLLITGLVDDYYDTSPYTRFFINFLIATIVILFGLGIPYVSNPFGGVIRLDQWTITIHLLGQHHLLILADIIAIIWLVWTTNMVNWSKGIDGQLPGFVSIAAIFLGLLAQRFVAHDISIQSVTTLAFIIAGAYLGFLPFNYYPQQIMPGYGGGALAGFLLGILSIISFGKFGTAFLILSVPMIDAVYAIVRRLKKHSSPFKADWGHFHHKLLEIGWGKRRIALFYWFVTFMFGIASLLLKGIEKVIAFVTVATILFIFVLIIERMKKIHS